MPHSPPCYAEGHEALAGDVVMYHGDRSTVEAVIVGSLIAEWGVAEAGIILQNASFGRVFVSDTSTDEDLVFVSRGA